MPIEDVWHLMSDYLYLLSKGYNVDIYNVVLMSNHFHMIVRCPEANLSEAMQYFMRQTSKSITRNQDRINQTYGSRFFRTLINNDHHLRTVYKYVYRNPVEAGLSDRVETYRFSTLYGLLGSETMTIPVIEDSILFSGVESSLSWLNEVPKRANREAVQKALRRPKFALPRLKNNGKAHPLNVETY